MWQSTDVCSRRSHSICRIIVLFFKWPVAGTFVLPPVSSCWYCTAVSAWVFLPWLAWRPGTRGLMNCELWLVVVTASKEHCRLSFSTLTGICSTLGGLCYYALYKLVVDTDSDVNLIVCARSWESAPSCGACPVQACYNMKVHLLHKILTSLRRRVQLQWGPVRQSRTSSTSRTLHCSQTEKFCWRSASQKNDEDPPRFGSLRFYYNEFADFCLYSKNF